MGSWLNESAIKVSEITKKKEALLCTGFPVRTDFSEKRITQFVKQVRTYKKVRILGSAALSLAYVACGRADAYMEENIMLWDVGVGCAIVKAAGGVIQLDNSNNILAPVNIIAKSRASL